MVASALFAAALARDFAVLLDLLSVWPAHAAALSPLGAAFRPRAWLRARWLAYQAWLDKPVFFCTRLSNRQALWAGALLLVAAASFRSYRDYRAQEIEAAEKSAAEWSRARRQARRVELAEAAAARRREEAFQRNPTLGGRLFRAVERFLTPREQRPAPGAVDPFAKERREARETVAAYERERDARVMERKRAECEEARADKLYRETLERVKREWGDWETAAGP